MKSKNQNQNQREQSYTLSGRREKRNEKKETIISNNPTTIHHHASHLVQEDMVAHQKDNRKVRFGHLVASNASSNGTYIIPSLAGA